MTTTVSQEAREAGLIDLRDADHALLLMDEVDSLVRFCSVNMLDADRYARGSWAFWSVCHWIARHRQQAERGEVWRPIETAPKDWTDVLVFSPEHEGFNCDGVFSAFYDTDEAGWSTHGPGHSIRLHPTHWQPLPTPPEAV